MSGARAARAARIAAEIRDGFAAAGSIGVCPSLEWIEGRILGDGTPAMAIDRQWRRRFLARLS